MSATSSLIIANTDENHPHHELIPSSSSSSFSTSSSCSSPDRQTHGYVLLNEKSRRKKRSLMPENKKDSIYWSQRSKNNLSAQRSRVKRRVNDLVLETKVTQLSNENQILRAKIDMLARKFGHLANDEDKLTNTSEKLVKAQETLEVLNSSKENPCEDENLLEKSVESQLAPLPVKWRLKLFSSSSNS